MVRLFSCISAIIIFVILVTGCSLNSSPTFPISETREVNNLNSSRWIMGLYVITIDPDAGDVSVLPMRSTQYTLNVNSLLEIKNGNLLITDLDLTDYESLGHVDCTVTLQHPFTSEKQYSGFDVKGVFISDGSYQLNYDDLIYAGDGDPVLRNPDGFTRWYNFSEFSGSSDKIFGFTSGKLSSDPNPLSTLNPYKIFSDGLGTCDNYKDWITSGENFDARCSFGSGSENSRRYELTFPVDEPALSFNYAVVANWEPGSDPFNPSDFPSNANSDEAFLISSDTTESDLFHKLPDSSGGTFRCEIEVFDWQVGLDDSDILDEIDSIILEADFFTDGSVIFDNADLASIVTLSTDYSSIFSVVVPDCEPVVSGASDFWIIVESKDDTYNQDIPGSSFPAGCPLAAFQKGLVQISDDSGYYYPPINLLDDSWETISPSSLGWDEPALNNLIDYVGENNSTAFIILYKGRILAEHYWDGWDIHSSDIIYSATKSVVACLIGWCREDGLLELDDPVSDYLGDGWTLATPEQESAITIRHLLKMSSGLVECWFFTELCYEYQPDTFWRYNTVAYQKLFDVIEIASGMSRNDYSDLKLYTPIGMRDSFWVPKRMSSSARDMARFGLMILSDGTWDGTTVFSDEEFFNDMLNSSQEMNPAYGYLWWLNGKDSYILPDGGTGTGPIIPSAPPDLVAALGHDDKKIYIVPSMDLVVVRHGDASNINNPDSILEFDAIIWEMLMEAAP